MEEELKKQKTYFLIGMMGAGKSWWGARLAERLHLPFVDLDREIETGEGATVSDIFATQGESRFRVLEREYLHRTALLPEAVVATGGGTPCFFDNMDWMNAHGTTVYLDTPIHLLGARLLSGKNTRPLLQGLIGGELESYLADVLRQREPYYLKAQVVIRMEAETDLTEELLRKA